METQTILYLPYRTAKLKAKYPIVYPMSAIVNHEILDIRGMVYPKIIFFSFQLKQRASIVAKDSISDVIKDGQITA